MKALSLKQPWAELVASGRKTVETRRWTTKYRGPLLIVASKNVDSRGLARFPKLESWQRGVAVATVALIDIRRMRIDDEEAACCGWYNGAFAWVLSGAERIGPFPVRGSLGLYEVEMPE